MGGNMEIVANKPDLSKFNHQLQLPFELRLKDFGHAGRL